MRLHFLEAADQEFNEAIQYYAAQRIGLDGKFYDEFRRAANDILAFPGSHRRVAAQCYKTNLHRFPYRIIYTLKDHDVFIVAVMHTSRRPGYWRDRIKP